MRFFVASTFGNHQIFVASGPQLELVAVAVTELAALRVAELLERFGLVEIPLPEGVIDPPQPAAT